VKGLFKECENCEDYRVAYEQAKNILRSVQRENAKLRWQVDQLMRGAYLSQKPPSAVPLPPWEKAKSVGSS
jgi:hypothetical protein